MLTKEQKDKIKLIDNLNIALTDQSARLSIQNIKLDIFKDAKGYEHEYLVVTYKGGAIATRNCNWNSNSANFDAVNKLLNGGYYDEVSDYLNLKKETQYNV